MIGCVFVGGKISRFACEVRHAAATGIIFLGIRSKKRKGENRIWYFVSARLICSDLESRFL